MRATSVGTVTITRKEAIKGGVRGLEPLIRAGAVDGLRAVGLGMLSTAKRKLMQGGTGTVYQKYNPRRQHRASAPGKPPATDTGGLVNSGAQEIEAPSLSAFIGFSKMYAAFLEYGTRTMGARPFLSTTAKEWEQKAADIISKAIKARLD